MSDTSSQPAPADRAALLNQLRIDRSEPQASSGRGKWWICAAIVIVIAGAAAWYFTRSSGILIRTSVAQAAYLGGAGATSTSLLDASGYVVARRRATVASKVTGKVVSVMLEEGQRVEAGQVTARLDDSTWRAAEAQSVAQLQQAKASVAAAQTAFDDAKPIFERAQKQKTAAVISAQSFDESFAQFNVAHNNLLVAQRGLEAAQAGVDVAKRNVDDTVIRAPFAGIVTEKSAQPGEMVSPISAGGGFTRTGIGTIVDMDSLEVEVDVSENFINRVSPQQPVNIKLNAYPDWEIPGSVIATIPTADRAKATVKVRIAIKQKDARILPEMGVRVSFLGAPEAEGGGADKSAAAHAVLVPADAIAANGPGSVAFVVHGPTVERRAVRLGAKTSAGQIVVAGLVPGDIVAVGDLTQLKDGGHIRVEKH
jgi:RND family efflux transporter MFP subunit